MVEQKETEDEWILNYNIFLTWNYQIFIPVTYQLTEAQDQL